MRPQNCILNFIHGRQQNSYLIIFLGGNAIPYLVLILRRQQCALLSFILEEATKLCTWYYCTVGTRPGFKPTTVVYVSLDETIDKTFEDAVPPPPYQVPVVVHQVKSDDSSPSEPEPEDDPEDPNPEGKANANANAPANGGQISSLTPF